MPGNPMTALWNSFAELPGSNVRMSSPEAKDIHNALLKYKIADEEYPYKPTQVAQLVTERSGK
jgi:hypothetical protein